MTVFFLLQFPGYGYFTLIVGQVKLQNNAGGDYCDVGKGEDKYCDPYVKFTLNDGESDPQVFTTNTITNAAGFASIDEVFHFKLFRRDTLKVHMEIYDANEEDITQDDKLMFEKTIDVEEIFKSMDQGQSTAIVTLFGNWRSEYLRNNETIVNRSSQP